MLIEKEEPDAFARCSNPYCGHTYRDHNPHPERGCLNCLCPAWNAHKKQHEAVARTLQLMADAMMRALREII